MLNGSSVNFTVQSTMGVDLNSRAVKGECQHPGAGVFTEDGEGLGCQQCQSSVLSGLGLRNWVLNSCFILESVGLTFSEKK